MLIQCKECGNGVSDKAPACPQCGAPVATAVAGVGVQTIEATSKRFKGVQLVGALMMIGGCPTMMAGGDAGGIGLLVLLVGFFVSVVGRVAAWWNHG